MSLSVTHPAALLLLVFVPLLARRWGRVPMSLSPFRRRMTLALRSLTLACLALALSGATFSVKSNDLTVVFLLDRSLSTGAESEPWQRSFIETALQGADSKSRFGIVTFGRDSSVERRVGTAQGAQLERFSAVVDRQATNLTSALRSASTIFPGDTGRRLVLLSDGRSTEAGALDESLALSAAGIELWTVPLPEDETPDLALTQLRTPSQLAVDEPFLLNLVIESRKISQAELLLSLNGRPHQRLSLELRDGPNLFLLPQKIGESGPVQFEARLLTPEDSRLENNRGEALINVGDRHRILILRSAERLAEGPSPLRTLLEGAGLEVSELSPQTLPRRLGAWRDVSSILVEDVSALDWELEQQKLVSLLVRDAGTGLMMTGGTSSFGIGGYQGSPLEALLPVNLAIRRPENEALAALILLLDKSGSMTGRPIEMAREAAIAAGRTLSSEDELGVVGFDSAARWLYRLQPRGNGRTFERAVAGLRAGGGTDLYPALQQALAQMAGSEAALKHLMVLSDGAVNPADFDPLLEDAVKQRITISAVALGDGADIRFLEDLTTKGKGRLYVVPENSGTLPQVFVRDTMLATGGGVYEKPTKVEALPGGPYQSVLSNSSIESAPPLAGYTLTGLKGGTAQTLLISDQGDPILALGRGGLGRTAAWTSDLGEPWAASWKNHSSHQTSDLLSMLLLRAVRAINAPGTVERRTAGYRLEVTSSSRGDTWSCQVNISSRLPLAGPVRVALLSPTGSTTEMVLTPDTPFSARGVLPWSHSGSGLALASTLEGDLLDKVSFAVPVAPELQFLGVDHAILRDLAQANGGSYHPDPQEVFRRKPIPVSNRRSLERALVQLSIFLLLLEVAVRRLPWKTRRRPLLSAEVSERLETSSSQIAALKKRKSEVRRPPPPATPEQPSALPAAIRWEEREALPSVPSLESEQSNTLARLKKKKREHRDQNPS